MQSTLSPELINAYAATEFRVLGPSQFTLRIGRPSPELLAAYAHLVTDKATFITAWNPFSEATDPATNRQRQDQLRHDVATLGFNAWEGIGIDPSSEWEGEESLLVFGMDRDQASGLGRTYQQNAIVWMDLDAVPCLVLLR